MVVNKTDFGRILRRAREAAGLTQQRLADVLGVTKGYLSNVERGERSPLSPDQIRRAAVELSIEPVDLFIEAALYHGELNFSPNRLKARKMGILYIPTRKDLLRLAWDLLNTERGPLLNQRKVQEIESFVQRDDVKLIPCPPGTGVLENAVWEIFEFLKQKRHPLPEVAVLRGHYAFSAATMESVFGVFVTDFLDGDGSYSDHGYLPHFLYFDLGEQYISIPAFFTGCKLARVPFFKELRDFIAEKEREIYAALDKEAQPGSHED